MKWLRKLIDPEADEKRLNAINRGIFEEGVQSIYRSVEKQFEKNCRDIRALPKDEQLGLYRFEVILTDRQVDDVINCSRQRGNQ